MPTDDVIALNSQLVTLTRRASVMEAQVEVLEGKRKALARFRDVLAELADAYAGVVIEAGAATVPRLGAGAGTGADSPMSRIVLNAQEDLRREIARAMHDGPAQSLTNIVLQAQIVERLLNRDLEGAKGELRLLVQMVQQTLDATKTFIFDVRPMVLDDLGLVPDATTRSAGARTPVGIPVDFDSMGADRRLAVDLESNLFRIVDEALAAYLGAHPDRVSIRLDWSDGVVEIDVGGQPRPHREDGRSRQAGCRGGRGRGEGRQGHPAGAGGDAGGSTPAGRGRGGGRAELRDRGTAGGDVARDRGAGCHGRDRGRAGRGGQPASSSRRLRAVDGDGGRGRRRRNGRGDSRCGGIGRLKPSAAPSARCGAASVPWPRPRTKPVRASSNTA
jgi:two-component system sensor histidine kinase DegS